MSMPIVSSEVISSIRFQGARSTKNINELYCFAVLKDIKKENPNLADAMIASIDLICSEHGFNTDDPNDVSLKVNMINLAVSIYASIKQQMICDELELV